MPGPPKSPELTSTDDRDWRLRAEQAERERDALRQERDQWQREVERPASK